MFTKKLFGVAGAALLMVSGAATARVDLSDTDATPIKYASEYVAGTGANALNIMHSGFSVTPDILIPENSYVRIDLRGAGAEFAGPLNVSFANSDTTDGQIQTAIDRLNSAGTRVITIATNESFAILQIRGDDVPLGTVITFMNPDGDDGDDAPDPLMIKVESTSGAVTAEVKFYDPDDLTEARGNVGATLDSESGAIAMFTPGLKVTVSEPRTFTASVATSFLNFVSGSNATATTATATLGTVTIEKAMDVHTPSMEQVTLTNLLGTGSTLTVEGDFTLTENEEGEQDKDNVTLSSAATVADVASSNSVPSKFAEDGGSIVYTFGAPAEQTYTLRLTAGGESAIQPSTYDYTFKFVAAGPAVKPEDKSGVFAEIVRDGLSVDIPYISTYSGYNHRLVLTNKGSRNADYQVEFRTEDGVTATAGTYARGTVPAREVMVIPMSKLVTLEGGTRAAGVITFEVPSTTITVATTQVTLADGSTDTVVLHSN